MDQANNNRPGRELLHRISAPAAPSSGLLGGGDRRVCRAPIPPVVLAAFRLTPGAGQAHAGLAATTHTVISSKAMPRLEVRVSEDLQRDLDVFAREDETTRNEFIRRAMALYAHARSEVNQVGTVILESAEGTSRQIVAL